MISLPVDSYTSKHKIFSVSKELIDKYLENHEYKTTELNELYADVFYDKFLDIATVSKINVNYNYFQTCMSIAYYLVGNLESIRWMCEGLGIKADVNYDETTHSLVLEIKSMEISEGLSKLEDAIKACFPYLIYDKYNCSISINNLIVTIDGIVITKSVSYGQCFRRVFGKGDVVNNTEY